MFSTITLAANQRVEFVEPFDFIRVMDTTATVSLEFYRAGREIDEANGVTAGYSESWAEPCDKLAITNGTTAQTITVATRLGSRVEYDQPPTGNVSVMNTPSVSVTNTPSVTTTAAAAAAVNQWQATVTSASQTIMNGTPGRRAFMIQNKSATGTVWLNLTGAAATQAAGVRLMPGETFTMDQRVPVGAITAIGDIASNAEVAVFEVQ